MNKVFVSSKKKPQQKLFRGFGRNKQRDDVSDTHTEYFPFSGGSGIDSFEFSPNYMSYEPQDTMVDTDVTLAEDDGFNLKKNIKKILVKGSKYEILGSEPGPNSLSASIDSTPDIESRSINNTPSKKAPENPPGYGSIEPLSLEYTSHTSKEAAPSASDDSNSSESSSLVWLLDLLEDFSLDRNKILGFIRYLAKKSVILAPIDLLADKFHDISLVVNIITAFELLVLMLLCDRVALLVRLLCSPAILLTGFLFSML